MYILSLDNWTVLASSLSKSAGTPTSFTSHFFVFNSHSFKVSFIHILLVLSVGFDDYFVYNLYGSGSTLCSCFAIICYLKMLFVVYVACKITVLSIQSFGMFNMCFLTEFNTKCLCFRGCVVCHSCWYWTGVGSKNFLIRGQYWRIFFLWVSRYLQLGFYLLNIYFQIFWRYCFVLICYWEDTTCFIIIILSLIYAAIFIFFFSVLPSQFLNLPRKLE